MKILKVAVVGFYLFAATAFAQVALPNGLTFKACKSMGEAAEAAMKARQGGIPVSKILELTSGDRVLVAITMGAYEQPRYYTEENQQRAVEDYRNTWEMMCLQAIGGT